MVTPELKWPMTNFTPSPTNLLATDTPSFGSARSSPTKISIFCPRMPPAALMSATACSTPFLSCAPKAALPPVIGPATPSLIWAEARVRESKAKAEGKAERKPLSHGCFPLDGSRWRVVRVWRPPRGAIQAANAGKCHPDFGAVGGWRIVAAAPAQDARALVDPTVAGDHLAQPASAGSRASRTPGRPRSRPDNSAATRTCRRTGRNGGSARRGSGSACRCATCHQGRQVAAIARPASQAAPPPIATLTSRNTPSELLLGQEFGDREAHRPLLCLPPSR